MQLAESGSGLVFKGTPLSSLLNKFLDCCLIQLIKGFSLRDCRQVIDTELEAEFFQILERKEIEIDLTTAESANTVCKQIIDQRFKLNFITKD